MKVIYKGVLRDIYLQKGRSFVTFFALLLVIAFPIAMFSTGPSIGQSISENNEEYHLAHLDFLLGNYEEAHLENISSIIKNSTGIDPEFIMPRIHTNSKIHQGDDWYTVHTMGINPNESITVNQVEIVEGTLKMNQGEIVVLKSFAEHLKLSIGDNLSIFLNNKTESFKIVGLVESVEFLSYELTQDGAFFLNEADLRDLLDMSAGSYNEILLYLYEGVTNAELQDCVKALREYLVEENISIYLLWHVREVSYSSILADSLNLTSSYLTTSAILIIIIVGIVIFIITKRYAIEQRKQTGMLYSYGFSSKMILQAFLLRTMILSLLAILLGTVGGWYLLKLLSGYLGNIWGLLSVSPQFSPVLVIEVILSTVMISLFFTYLAARENISLTPYEAIRGKAKEFVRKHNISSHLKYPMQLKIPFRNLSRNKMRSIMTVLAFSGSIMLSFSLITTQTSLSETQDEYFNLSQWDVQATFTEDISGALYYERINDPAIITIEPYLQWNVQFTEESEKMVNLRGILQNSSLMSIDLQEGDNFSEDIKNEVILSQFCAERFGYSIGDNISFWLFNAEINVNIIGLSRVLDFPIAMFIQLEYLESILGSMPINAMIADVDDSQIESYTAMLNENPDVKIAVTQQVYRDQIRAIIASQTIIVNIMVILGLVVSFLSIFSTTLIIVIEREREYSLQRVFGFSSKQILIQIFIEILLLTLVALLLGFLGGNYLSIYWKDLVKDNFFSVDNFFLISDYLILIGFAVGANIVSLFPEFISLKKQDLAEGIKE